VLGGFVESTSIRDGAIMRVF